MIRSFIRIGGFLVFCLAHGYAEQLSVIEELKRKYEECYPLCGSKPDGVSAMIQQDKQGAVYSTPAPERNWNLLTSDGAGTAIVPHLYEAECNKILLEVLKRAMLAAPYKAECFQTPES